MHKLDQHIARLKLLLAEVGAKKEALAATRHQYAEQINRLINFTVHAEVSVDRGVAMMMDIDARLRELERQEHYLDAIHAAARRELDSLQLTKIVEEARAQLALLRQRQHEQTQGEPDDPAWLSAEIQRLEEVITVASGAAARSVSAGLSS